MLSDKDILAMIQSGESDCLELTASVKDKDKFCEAICAFSNDLPAHGRPGHLVVGASDDGTLAHLQIDDTFLRSLADIHSDGNIQPLPSMTVRKVQFPAGDVAVVEVHPADLPPVRYRGRVYVRIGPSRRIANEGEERILLERRTARARPFDARPCKGCGIADLVQDLFLVTYRPQAISREVIEENSRDIRTQLASLRFYDLKHDCATHAGALLFAKDPLNWLPGAYLQFIRLRGTRLSDDVTDDRTFSGDLLTLLRELDAFLPAQIAGHPESVSALRERARCEYPGVALRELLMNAVMHRDYESNAPVRFSWYEDRIEIQNPGGLYGSVRPENFPRQTDYRNPVIAEAMKNLGFVNRYGRGVERAQAALRENGNPEPEFTFEPTYFLATVLGKP